MKMETRESDILSNSRFSHRNLNWLDSVNFGGAIPQRWFMRDPWALRLLPLAPLYVLLCLIISGEPVKTLSSPGLCISGLLSQPRFLKYDSCQVMGKPICHNESANHSTHLLAKL